MTIKVKYTSDSNRQADMKKAKCRLLRKLLVVDRSHIKSIKKEHGSVTLQYRLPSCALLRDDTPPLLSI